ncbi:NEAT domain-containing protein [Gemella haemolysans]|uniref:NEAT domain-containing protein n=1 Tax=Gemella haemolysans TaxID=1379 RepID=UPI000F6BFD4D|nr:NEAT domain-containing protein [Gemella haemolysans]UBH82626.1 NEAT domain-containing protein [Gemella haemolysans]VEI39119.1 Ribosomal protein S2 [Gemella haemolysans]
MKNTTLLKVLSATAIFSAVAAIEAYDQDSFAFAAEETPVVANTTTSSTKTTTTQPTAQASTTGETNSQATPAANSAAAPATTSVVAPATTAPKAEEPATVAQDVKALKDGEYKITAEALKFDAEGSPSMAAAAIDNDKTKLIVKNGQYSVNVSFKPITFGGLKGYLGDLKYYDGDKTHENRKEIQKSEFKDSTIVENYSASDTDNFVNFYKKEFPGRTVYPKTVNYNVDKNKIDSNNKLETFTEVFVPVMASINPDSGTQKMTLKFDLSSLARKKVTADNYQAATYENPNKDVEYKGTIKKDFPIHVQGHLRNANNNDEESLYGSALDNYVKVEKVGDKYKYTLRFKKGLADVGGEFYPFELHKVAYQGKDVPLTTLATNGNSSVKEGSIITDKLLEKIQLDGTAPYPNGALMSHFVTLKLYYETATDYKERPVKLEDVVAPAKPKPVKPAPTKPKEEPKPATPTAADHNVDADKVPNTFPTTVKAELNGRTTGTASIYENAFVKDVKVEKVGDKYQYTIQVKEGKSTNFLLRNKPFTVSKLTYKGTEINFTEVDAATKLKEGKILTDSLLDKIQVDAVLNVQTKGGAKPRFEDRAAESTIALDFPKVEKPKEVTPAKPSVPDHEVAADKVPTTFPATIKGELNGRTTDSSSIYEDAFVKDVKVEKVGDKYQYTIQVKEGKSSTYLLRNKPFTVSKLTYKGTEVNFTEVDATTKLKEGKILTDSLLDKIQVDTVISVQTRGGAKPRFEERNAENTISLDFPTAEKVKEEAANNLVPAIINNLHESNRTSMADGALVHEKTRVEKVNDTYNYYLTFKDLNIASLVGTVDTLTVDGTAAERTDLGGESHEKVFHFTSPEKLTEKTITFSVSVDGKPLRGHSNVAATLKFNWDGATPLTADQVTSLHKDETTKAQAEKERLEKEAAAKAQAEKERLEKEKAQKAEADRLEKERLEKEAAVKAQTEKERLEKEKAQKAEADRLEKERLEKEAAAKAQAEKERLEKEKAQKAEADRLEKERLEKEAAAKAQAEKERLEKEKAQKAEADRLEKERLEKEAAAKAQAEKERLEKEKAQKAEADRLEKERLEKEAATKAQAEKEQAKLEELKKVALANIATDKDVNKEEAAKLKEIVNTASLKDTLVAKVVENGSSEEIKVSFDNSTVKASKFSVEKADKETVAKVEELVKKADENLSVVKTIDLHFTDSKGTTIDKQGETRAVTVAVVANENEKLEVYYVNGNKLEKVPSVYKDGKLTFFTNHFSLYTIVKEGINPSNNKTKFETGDALVQPELPALNELPKSETGDALVQPELPELNEISKAEKGEALIQPELPALSEIPKSETGDALVQPELPELNINDLNKEQKVKEQAQPSTQDIFGQNESKEDKKTEVEKTTVQKTSQTVAKGLKALANTGVSSTATVGLGALVLLSALVLRRKNNK